jgi:hypothetical protein
MKGQGTWQSRNRRRIPSTAVSAGDETEAERGPSAHRPQGFMSVIKVAPF